MLTGGKGEGMAAVIVKDLSREKCTGEETREEKESAESRRGGAAEAPKEFRRDEEEKGGEGAGGTECEGEAVHEETYVEAEEDDDFTTRGKLWVAEWLLGQSGMGHGNTPQLGVGLGKRFSTSPRDSCRLLPRLGNEFMVSGSVHDTRRPSSPRIDAQVTCAAMCELSTVPLGRRYLPALFAFLGF